MLRALAILCCTFCSLLTIAQSIKVAGTIENIHGETLPAAQILVLPDSVITLSDDHGGFSLQLNQGTKRFRISFVGYTSIDTSINISTLKIRFRMIPSSRELDVITIEDSKDQNSELFGSNQTSTNILTKEDISSIPVLGGEADVIKTLQLLPGTIRGVEGSSDLFIRGGAADQNLVLLDGAPIYNTSHLFGFLSVFNPDAVERVESMNGGFPARYGGRLSSILNVTTTNQLPAYTQVSGEVGLIASRLMIEQPIIRNKASFWIAGRRTYIDQVVRAVGEELPYFFYDLNGKFIYAPDEKNKLEISYYGGEDILDIFRDRNNDGDGFLTSYVSGNDTQALNWTRTLRKNFTTTLSANRSSYRYNIKNTFEDNRLLAASDIEDYNAHIIFSIDSMDDRASSFRGGVEWTRHAISPNIINTAGIISELLKSSSSSARIANEFSVHAEYGFQITGRLRVAPGIRVSSAVVKNNSYVNPEPRASARYAVDDQNAIKISYGRMAQYIHRISNSAVSTPTDIWYPVTDTIQPQTSQQIAIAWQRLSRDQKFYLSVEGYYKTMHNLIGYEQGTNLFFNTDFESKLIQGDGRAFGLEFLIRKDKGKLTGWLSYTLSRSVRRFDEVENGNWFPARYDRRHNGAIVSQYQISKRFSASVVWEFISGARFTPIIGQYSMLAPTLTGVDLIPVFSEVNGVKLADTHRLDVGIKFKSKPGKKFQWHWFAGVYNAYNRATPVGITITQDETDGSLKYEQPGLFGLLPFISYGFHL